MRNRTAIEINKNTDEKSLLFQEYKLWFPGLRASNEKLDIRPNVIL